MLNIQETASTAIDTRFQDARARSQLYLLLARIFQSEIDKSFFEHLNDPEIKDTLESLDIDLDPLNSDQDPEHILEILREEYAYLFLGPGKHIAPYESVQLKRGAGLLMGKETVEVCQFIKDAGFDFTASDGKIPDHISIELEFLGHLAEAEAKALEADKMVEYLAYIGWQHKFITTHLGKWTPDFSRRVKARASVPFYKSFAAILPRFIASEKAWLGKTMHDQMGGE